MTTGELTGLDFGAVVFLRLGVAEAGRCAAAAATCAAWGRAKDVVRFAGAGTGAILEGASTPSSLGVIGSSSVPEGALLPLLSVVRVAACAALMVSALVAVSKQTRQSKTRLACGTLGASDWRRLVLGEFADTKIAPHVGLASLNSNGHELQAAAVFRMTERSTYPTIDHPLET